MHIFQTTTGIGKVPVTVIFWVVDGAFDGFYVIANHHQENEMDVTQYMGKKEILTLEYEAQRHYLEKQVNINEREIIDSNGSHPLDHFCIPSDLSLGLI